MSNTDYRLRYYTWRKKTLKKRAEKKPTTRRQNAYYKVAMNWWRRLTKDFKWGTDLTETGVSINDVRDHIREKYKRVDPRDRPELRADYAWSRKEGKNVFVGDRSIKVEFVPNVVIPLEDGGTRKMDLVVQNGEYTRPTWMNDQQAAVAQKAFDDWKNQ